MLASGVNSRETVPAGRCPPGYNRPPSYTSLCSLWPCAGYSCGMFSSALVDSKYSVLLADRGKVYYIRHVGSHATSQATSPRLFQSLAIGHSPLAPTATNLYLPVVPRRCSGSSLMWDRLTRVDTHRTKYCSSRPPLRLMCVRQCVMRSTKKF